MASITLVRCESHDGIVDRWTAQFSNGTQETYNGEVPPQNVSRFCRKARYSYKDMSGNYLGEVMVDCYSNKPLTKDERKVQGQ
jgi:hypothetical protein